MLKRLSHYRCTVKDVRTIDLTDDDHDDADDADDDDDDDDDTSGDQNGNMEWMNETIFHFQLPTGSGQMLFQSPRDR